MCLHLPLPVLLLLLIRHFPSGVRQCTLFDVINEIIKSQNSLNHKWSSSSSSLNINPTKSGDTGLSLMKFYISTEKEFVPV